MRGVPTSQKRLRVVKPGPSDPEQCDCSCTLRVFRSGRDIMCKQDGIVPGALLVVRPISVRPSRPESDYLSLFEYEGIEAKSAYTSRVLTNGGTRPWARAHLFAVTERGGPSMLFLAAWERPTRAEEPEGDGRCPRRRHELIPPGTQTASRCSQLW